MSGPSAWVSQEGNPLGIPPRYPAPTEKDEERPHARQVHRGPGAPQQGRHPPEDRQRHHQRQQVNGPPHGQSTQVVDGRRQQRKAVVIHRRPSRPERQPRREVALGDGRRQRPVLQFLVVLQHREGAGTHRHRHRQPGDQPDEHVRGVHRRAPLRVGRPVGGSRPSLPPPPNDHGQHEQPGAQTGRPAGRDDVGQRVCRHQPHRQPHRRGHAPCHVGRPQAPAPPGHRPADQHQPGNPKRYYQHPFTRPANAVSFLSFPTRRSIGQHPLTILPLPRHPCTIHYPTAPPSHSSFPRKHVPYPDTGRESTPPLYRSAMQRGPGGEAGPARSPTTPLDQASQGPLQCGGATGRHVIDPTAYVPLAATNSTTETIQRATRSTHDQAG